MDSVLIRIIIWLSTILDRISMRRINIGRYIEILCDTKTLVEKQSENKINYAYNIKNLSLVEI